MQVQGLTEPRDDLRQAGRRIGLGADGARGAGDEFERALDLGSHVFRRPEIGAVKDGAQHLADVAVGALPRGYSVVDAAVRWIVIDEPLAQLPADVMHRRWVTREHLQESDALVHPVALRKGDTQHLLFAPVVRPVVELEVAAPLGTANAPACEDAGDRNHVLLRVSPVHAEGVQLEQLAGVVLVEALRLSRGRSRTQGIHAGRVTRRRKQEGPTAEERSDAHPCGRRRCCARRDAFPVVEVEEHRGTLGGRDQKVRELAHRVGADRVLDVIGGEKPVGALRQVDVEVIEPEVHHDFVELALREDRADDGKIREFTREAPALALRRGRRGVLLRCRLLAVAPFPLRLGVHRRKVAAVIVEEGELALPLGEHVVVDPVGRELPVDPVHHTSGGHARHLAGSRSVRQAVQGLEGGVLRGEGRLLAPEAGGNRRQCAEPRHRVSCGYIDEPSQWEVKVS